jgi:hypothetical protein
MTNQTLLYEDYCPEPNDEGFPTEMMDMIGAAPDAYVQGWDPNDPFCKGILALLDLYRGFAEAARDLTAYHAPSECYRDVARGNRHELDETMAEMGYTFEGFYREFEQRVNRDWACMNALPGFYIDPDDGLLYIENV